MGGATARVEGFAVDGGETEFVVYSEDGEVIATVRKTFAEAAALRAEMEITNG